MSFKLYLNETEEKLQQINSTLNDMSNEELDDFGSFLYYEFFDNEESEFDDYDYFERSDVDSMIADLSPTFYDDIIDMLSDYEEDDETNEAVSRILKTQNRNRKKRKYMSISKSSLRKTKVKRKQDARKNKAKRKRYYRANKAKIAAYQKSRREAIKSGKHIVKLRKKA